MANLYCIVEYIVNHEKFPLITYQPHGSTEFPCGYYCVQLYSLLPLFSGSPLALWGGWGQDWWSCPLKLGRSDERPYHVARGFFKLVSCFHLLCYSSYLKAQQLAPKDGKPYNQLAIIAINAVSFGFHLFYHFVPLSFRTTKITSLF